jgi:hypothetical protein
MKVFVYWNLHKGKWSIKALEGPNKGRVIDRADTVLLQVARPKVSEAGRQRVLKEKRKNVHAGVVGYLVNASDVALAVPAESYGVTYNPYFYSTFVHCDDKEKSWAGSNWALLQGRKVYAVG